MNEPRRLSLEGDPLVRRMLEAAEGEEPSERAMQQTLAALGVGSALLGISGVTAGATSAATAAGTTASMAPLSGAGVATASGGGAAGAAGAGVTMGALTVGAGVPGAGAAVGVAGKLASAGWLTTATKLGAVSMVGGALTFGVLETVSAPPATPDTATIVAARPRAVPQESFLPRTSPLAAPQRTGEVESQPEAVAPPEAVRVTPSPGGTARVQLAEPVEPAPPSEIEREVTLVDGARAALSQGDAVRALAVLGDYRAQFPRGRLAPEAGYLEMQALDAAGDRERAEAAARKLLSEHPAGPHSARAKALLLGSKLTGPEIAPVGNERRE